MESDRESSRQTDLQAIQKKIVARDYRAALDGLDRLPVEDSHRTETLYLRAVCCRYLGDHDTALATLSELKSRSPEHGRAYQEEGHNYRLQNRYNLALQAYTNACQLNPALEASWRAQYELYTHSRQVPQAGQAKAQLERLLRLPKPLVAVTDLIAQKRLVKAEQICRQFLQKVPHHIEAMRLLAGIGSRLGILDDAEYLLESAVAFAPDNIQARMDYIQVLRKRQKFTDALDQARYLQNRLPTSPQFKSLVAVVGMQTGDFEQAIQLFDEVLAAVPDDPVTLTSRGHALKTSGKYRPAVCSYRDAILSLSSHGEAYYSLANLKTYRFEDHEIDAMLQQERDTSLTHMNRVYFCFALGKAYEDLEEYETAFHWYDKGNCLMKAQSSYQADRMTSELRQQITVCTQELFAGNPNGGSSAPDPIFIVGLPRAGSTLLEQILSSHSQVDGTLELPNILTLAHRLGRGKQLTGSSRYPGILGQMTAREFTDLGEEYLHDTRIHRQGAPLFIDKMPNNFRHIGLIKLILPNAKVIDARRHPMACCFSGYKQLFAEGQEFTYDLSDIGRYYRDYVMLMDHWDRVIPGFVFRIQHEELVADPEQEIRRMLDFCRLPFEESCLNFHETERAVRTPSSEQVRQPIFSTSLDQWQHFAPYLSPLSAALEESGSRTSS